MARVCGNNESYPTKANFRLGNLDNFLLFCSMRNRIINISIAPIKPNFIDKFKKILKNIKINL